MDRLAGGQHQHRTVPAPLLCCTTLRAWPAHSMRCGGARHVKARCSAVAGTSSLCRMSRMSYVVYIVIYSDFTKKTEPGARSGRDERRRRRRRRRREPQKKQHAALKMLTLTRAAAFAVLRCALRDCAARARILISSGQYGQYASRRTPPKKANYICDVCKQMYARKIGAALWTPSKICPTASHMPCKRMCTSPRVCHHEHV